jgi:lysozyme family protein
MLFRFHLVSCLSAALAATYHRNSQFSNRPWRGEPMANWRLSKSLEKLRQQVNAAAPGRSRSSDGTIGDVAHSARKSDHNPDAKGIVRAIDITHDPKGGVDSEKLAEALRLSRDQRISYIISNRKIAASYAVHGEEAWTWRPYAGANAHDKHCHISVVADDGKADDVRPWGIDMAFATAKPSAPIVAKPVRTDDRRTRMGRVILGYEARRDSQGRLAVYKLPSNDGGGTYEVAGINDRYHPAQAAQLSSLIQAGRFEEAEASAVEYILKYTDAAAGWTTNAGVEFFLRDCIFNRGPTGAAKILQIALGVSVDGAVGGETRDALSKIEPGPLLDKLRAARERYEDMVAPGRPNLRAGLVSRWNKALAAAQQFATETPTTKQGTIKDAGKVIVATGVGGGAAHGAQAGWGIFEWSMFGLGILSAVALAYVIWRYVWPWWKSRRADLPAPPTAADLRELLMEHRSPTAERLPAPEFVRPAPKPPARRKPGKAGAKTKIKKKPTKKRKAA